MENKSIKSVKSIRKFFALNSLKNINLQSSRLPNLVLKAKSNETTKNIGKAIIREVFDKEIESANKSSMVIFVERRNSLLRKSSFANVYEIPKKLLNKLPEK